MTETPASPHPPFPLGRPTGCPFDPASAYAALREEAPLTKVSTPAGVDAWMVSRYDDLRTVLRDRRLSSRLAPSDHVVEDADLDREVDAGSILNLDGAEHTRLRRLLTTEFTVKRIEALRPRIQQIIDVHIDALLASPRPVDLVRDFALPIPSLVICELLGVPYADRDVFQRQSAQLVAVDVPLPEAEAVAAEMQQYMAGLVMAKLEQPADDLLSRLIERANSTERPLSMEELVSIGITLLIAGHETTANMIALSTLVLLRNPDQLKVLQEHPELAPTATEELLRYLSVVQFGVFRQVTEDMELASEQLKAGEFLIAALSAGNRDESVYPAADQVDLSRRASTHLAFGFGPHQCLGQQLARVELQEVFTRLYRRIPTLRLAVPFEEIDFKHNTLVYGVKALPVTWDDPR
ncbi:cytochrome P450 [Kribbella sp. NBC_01245]|uniref:cytochrome P450 n=1 Tax=Kribbella sp. NBC_01245 TaxID=2903578 RepID=UPI002E2E2794|nr:cytochrome P450 [Kribbella sp. NBC_01245]